MIPRPQLRWLWLFVSRPFHPLHSNALKGTALIFGLSLLPLTTIYVLTTSMIEGIYERSVETFYYHAQIKPKGHTSFSPDLLKDLDLPPLQGLWEERQGFALLATEQDQREAILLRGLEPSFLAHESFWRYLNDEENQSLTRPPLLNEGEIALGRSVAEALEIRKGETLNLVTMREIAGRLVPRLTPVKVALIFSTGYAELDRTWGLVNLFEHEPLFDPSREPLWGVKFENVPLRELPTITDQLNHKESPITWIPWQILNVSQRENFTSLQILFNVLFSLIVLVAAFNVSSAMIIYTIDQKRPLAVLKAIGASPFWLGTGLTLLGTLIGFLGSLLGIGLSLILTIFFNPLIGGLFSVTSVILSLIYGLLELESPSASWSAYYLIQIPAFLPFSFIAVILGASLVLTTLASLWTIQGLKEIKPIQLLS